VHGVEARALVAALGRRALPFGLCAVAAVRASNVASPHIASLPSLVVPVCLSVVAALCVTVESCPRAEDPDRSTCSGLEFDPVRADASCPLSFARDKKRREHLTR
jgi:hypothetical protein